MEKEIAMSDKSIKLEISTPKGVFSAFFDKTAKIIDVIKTVVAAKGFDNADDFDLVLGEKTLEPENRPLVSFGVADCATLTLVATGSGV